MARSSKYSREMRERAVALVMECQREYDSQWEAIREELDEAVNRVLASGRYILGPEVEALEAELAAFCGAAHC